MKLISLYVSSFGKLRDFSFDFNDKLNTIKHENGWGKSTLATFIKCIFYGVSGSKNRNISENERAKYKPWNSTEKFGGHVVFEWGGNEYKLQRYFGTKDSDDEVRLFDLKTGKEHLNTENLGRRIFEIDEEGFLSTTYFSQKDFKIKSNTSITNKYNSVCEIKNTETFDDAIKALEDKIKDYKALRGDKGLISNTKQKIAEIEDKIVRASESEGNAKKVLDKAKGIKENIDKLSQRRDLLTKEIAKESSLGVILERKKQYESLREERDNALKKIKIELEKTGGKSPKVDDVEQLKKCVNDYKTAIQNIESISSFIAEISLQKEPQKKSNALSLILFIVSAILVVGGGLSFLVNTFLAIGVLAFGVVALALGFVAKNKMPYEPNANLDLIESKKAELKGFKDIEQKYYSTISEYLAQFGMAGQPFESALDELGEVAKTVLEHNMTIAFVEKHLSKFESEIESFKDIKESSNVDQLNDELKRVNNEYSLLSDEYAGLKASVDYYLSESNSLPDLESTREELLQQLLELKEEYEIYKLTYEYLSRADENLKTKYRAPLKQSLNKYFSLITGVNDGVEIDIDLNVTALEKEGAKSTEFYSKGYQNLFEICKRFALTDVLFTAEKPFIILDDPFYNLDDEKIVSALNLIEKLSHEYQIIYFVCHDSRAV